MSMKCLHPGISFRKGINTHKREREREWSTHVHAVHVCTSQLHMNPSRVIPHSCQLDNSGVACYPG